MRRSIKRFSRFISLGECRAGCTRQRMRDRPTGAGVGTKSALGPKATKSNGPYHQSVMHWSAITPNVHRSAPTNSWHPSGLAEEEGFERDPLTDSKEVNDLERLRVRSLP